MKDKLSFVHKAVILSLSKLHIKSKTSFTKVVQFGMQFGAARLGSENSDKKSKPAVAHTQPILKFLSSAHTGVLDGINGRDENQGMEKQRCQGD